MNALPEKFEETLRGMLGGEYPAFKQSLETQAAVSVRLHPAKGDTHLPIQGPVPWSRYGRYLSDRPAFTLDPQLHGGSYYVQEASSMFLEQALTQSVDVAKDLRVLDLCAAPGGKSTHMLTVLSRDSVLVSNEAIRSRAMVLSENVQKCGYPNAIVTNNDPSDFQRLEGFFDVMVIDAPCSGEGLFRKDPQAMNEWSPESVQMCSSRQKRIVADAWSALRRNGILIYCTCTYNELENEDNLRWLKENHSVEFIRLSCDPSWGVEEVRDKGILAYRFFPHKAKGEGFFISVMQKTKGPEHMISKNKSGLATPLKAVKERMSEWIVRRDAHFFQFNDLAFYVPGARAKEMEFLIQRLRVLYAGTNVARIKHDKLVPEHALALSTELNRGMFPAMGLSLQDALTYLRKEPVQVNGAPRGFNLVTYEGLGLGWANVLPGRMNNMYPSEWRIRMNTG
jgi:16S rRNA C967 or C1407 C5-methylase (RsmB/RsmF family)/NOL1/NOP2/fmu family ribosome biogenesis protein